MKPIIKSLLLHRYRSFLSEQVDFGNPTFFVGQNGSGKSNLVDALVFLSEAMTAPLATVFSRRGGLPAVKYRSHARLYGRRLELGVVLGSLGRGIMGARYAFAVDMNKRGFEIVREQCVIDLADGERRWFDRDTNSYKSNAPGLAPVIDPASLAMPIVGGDKRFRCVPHALGSMRVCAIEPSRLRGEQNANGYAGLAANGANAAAVLAEIEKRAPDDLMRICELLEAVVPGVSRVWPARHGDRLEIEFMQRWGSQAAVQFKGADMSDGTLRALGLLLAAYQRPRPTVLAVEEPEATIHPGALEVVLDVLRHASRFMQVIVTTHSPEVLDAEWLEDRHLRMVDWSDGKSRIEPVSEGTRKAMRSHLMSAGEMFRSNALSPSTSTSTRRDSPPPLFLELA